MFTSTLSRKFRVAILISTFAVVHSANASCNDDFENGSISKWTYTNTGGFGSSGVENHNGSNMAFVAHQGWGSSFQYLTNSSSLSCTFTYNANDFLSFDMHATAVAASGNPSGTQHSGSGVRISFLNIFNVPIGSIGLFHYTNPAQLGPNEFQIANTQQNYAAPMSEFAMGAGIDPQVGIAKVSLTFSSWGQFAGGGNIYPSVGATAKVWFDNVAVSPIPEPGTFGLALSSFFFIYLCIRRTTAARETTNVSVA